MLTIRMNYLFILLIAGGIAGLSGATTIRREPPCKCEVTFYKKKRGVLPCIVGIIRDSASQKPLEVAAVIVNNIVTRTGKGGYTYCEVVSGKECTLIAKCFTYYFCTKKVVAHEGDSIVCVFNMRRNREPSDGPGDFIRPSFFKRLSTSLKR